MSAYRDLDDTAQLTESVAADLFDLRPGSHIRHERTALPRQSIRVDRTGVCYHQA